MYDTLDVQKSLVKQLNMRFPNIEVTEVTRINSTRNKLYLAKTGANQQNYVFKLTPLHTSHIPYVEYRAMHEIHRLHGPVSRPVPMEKECVVHLNDEQFAVNGYEYIQGNTLSPTETNFHSLGVSIGHLHQVSIHMDKPSWLPEVTVSDLINEPIEAISQKCRDNGMFTTAIQQATMVAEVLHHNRNPDWIGFSHGDAHHINAIQTSRDEIVWIDLEDASWQWRGYDLATAIWGTFGRGGSANIWNELINGYTSVRSLSEEEATLIRFLIFSRHLWWLGLHANNWDRWPKPYTSEHFFQSGIELLVTIGKDVCGLKT
ncbi:phosphotransferase enzyme family protein [Evansella sp. AB-rgal1]|uniref:phosphotransferase enzyme family protein n=1 Tax=Evansella sp. AB-rgal1 TaxID=3242696 RepID=UPI00359EA8EB